MFPDHALNVHASIAQLSLFSHAYISTGYLLDMLSELFSLEYCVKYLVYNELLYITLQLTNNNLGLQVYCSPSLKELLHNTVMTVLTCNMERTGSILHAHGVVCVNVHAYLCVKCVCVVVCTCALACASERWIQIYKYTISNHTSTKQDSYISGNCSGYMFTTDKI